ncbi:MAG: hypothetical protein IJ092_06335 [Atopobiaceae bacterium]|nr:hypothetical protein [Atopobiaceae bacterium]
MAKSKLERAVEDGMEGLSEAQRELVRSQLSVYRRNAARLAQVESELNAWNARPAATLEEVRVKQSQRATLSHEINQLSTANAEISEKLFRFMEVQ